MKKLRLLPENSPLGWTPYAWLTYLPTLLIEPVIRTQHGRAGLLYWAATIAALVIFLVLYFRGYWVRGRQLMPIIGGILALAVAFTPVNVGACVLYVYAGAFAGNLDRPRHGARLIVAIALVAAAMGVFTQPPLFYWVTGVGITIVVGFVNLHFAQVERAGRKLRLAHREIEQLAAVAERERIARDLHDVLGHTLSLIVLKAELAGRIAERDPARAIAEMHDVETVARRTLQEVREAIRGYRATLAEEVERSAAMLKAAGIRAEIDAVPTGLPAAIEETLALALREAVTNVVRHSGAARCSITASVDAGRAVLTVGDDGRGATGPEGHGLRGMRERVAAFGGTVELLPGRGMHLRVTLPGAVSPSRVTPRSSTRPSPSASASVSSSPSDAPSEMLHRPTAEPRA